MPDKSQKWYHNWFNSPYYHILYKQRDEEEAELFMDNLCALLTPPKEAQLLDIACGRGRHAIYLNKKGYDVTGIDLSEESIKHATLHENAHLHFFVHDMRNLFYINHFDFAFNLFTSFGYFENRNDNNKAMRAFASTLRQGGKLVLDFMNTQKIINSLVIKETKESEGIVFHINRKVENGFIVKEIIFADHDKNFAFKEEVQALMQSDFEDYFKRNGLEVERIFGDYELNPFDTAHSDRLIFVCRKV